MSYRLKIAAFAAAATLSVTVAHAEDPSLSSENVMQLLSSKLQLTDSQNSAIAPVIAERQQKLRALRNDESSSGSHRRAARAILTDSDKQIYAVLSPDQQQQYKQLEKQMIARFRQRSSAQ